RNLPEAVATVRMLEQRGYNFSLGVAQVNRYNLGKYGLDSYEKAFEICPNLQAGSRILAECYSRSNNDWGKSFSCYYSGNFVTGFRHGYVQKIYASMNKATGTYPDAQAIAVVGMPNARGSLNTAASTAPVYAPGRQAGSTRMASLVPASRVSTTTAADMGVSMPQFATAGEMPVQALAAAAAPGVGPSAPVAPVQTQLVQTASMPQPVRVGVATAVPQLNQPVKVSSMNAAPAAGPATVTPPQSKGDQAFVF
ncbi:MAG: lytic transglycosylase domain-containing protein, partial [Lysobacter sp.]